jgi:chromatin remodeling complex protein RSC6
MIHYKKSFRRRVIKVAIAGKANAAFMKRMTPSPALAEVISAKPTPRTEVPQDSTANMCGC